MKKSTSSDTENHIWTTGNSVIQKE